MIDRRTFLVTAAAAVAGPIRTAGAAGHRLRAATRTIDVNGRAATVYGLTGTDGRPGLVLDAGTDFDVLMRNDLAEQTLIHWHGLTPPWSADGVPGAPEPMIDPGAERAWRFPVGHGGTHWMHAHTLQEQNLLAAPLIVRTALDRATDEQDVVLMLHDFSFTPAEELLVGLMTGPAHAHDVPVVDGGVADVAHESMAGMEHAGIDPATEPVAVPDPHAGHDAGPASDAGLVGAMDLNDIAYDAYLANDRTLDDPEVHVVERGGMVRLRIINGASATGFTIDLGALDGTLIAVDGSAVVPVRGRRFPVSMGQRIDLRVRMPVEGGAFPILALREGARERTGLVLATAGAAVEALPVEGTEPGPILDLALEATLQAAEPLAPRPADRRFSVELAGTMAGYAWGLPGAEAITIRQGERIEIEMRNVSMMAHPMHLHGHRFQVVGIDGMRYAGPVRDTVLVPPRATVTIAFDADNPGRWAFHCHHLYHMVAGMMGTVSYDGLG